MHELGFIGSGNMAEAIVRSAIDAGVLSPEQIVAADPSPERREVMASIGVHACDDNAEVVADARQVVLAVKPQAAAGPAAEIGAHLRDDHVVISIMAGLSTSKLAALIRVGMPAGSEGQRIRLVRVMPNTPLMVGKGMAGVALGADTRPGDDDLAIKLLAAGGEAVRVDEAAIDAITAVSGSGPAYLFYLAEAMQRAAADLGLGEHARLLVSQTLAGAAELLARSDDDAATLRKKVASPGGTTEAALNTLDDKGVSDAIVEAIRSAERRSRELGG
ncbi:MAG: pyrroline-5-carboxylate reductase [Phycisphaeraceae bacterium]